MEGGGFASSWIGASSGHGVGWMVGLKGLSQELLRQHPQVVLDGEHLCLIVEVSDMRPPGAACGNVKCMIPNPQQFFYIGWVCIGESHWSCIVKYGVDEEIVGDSLCLHLLSPVGGAEESEEVYPK